MKKVTQTDKKIEQKVSEKKDLDFIKKKPMIRTGKMIHKNHHY